MGLISILHIQEKCPIMMDPKGFYPSGALNYPPMLIIDDSDAAANGGGCRSHCLILHVALKGAPFPHPDSFQF